MVASQVQDEEDSVMMVETLITASPEFMLPAAQKEQKARIFTMALDFISERVGEKNILSAVVHGRENAAYAPVFCADYSRQ